MTPRRVGESKGDHGRVDVAGPADLGVDKDGATAKISSISLPERNRIVSKSWIAKSKNRPPSVSRSRSGRLGIAVGHVERVDLARLSGLDRFPHADEARVKPPVEAYWSFTPAAAAAARACSIRSGSNATGFSQKMCLPAEAAVGSARRGVQTAP